MKWIEIWAKALRVHQWCKNVLVFVPLMLSGFASEWERWVPVVVVFVAMSALASATYLLNDWRDVEDDRKHWHKKHRPQAAGLIKAHVALPVAAVLAVAGVLFGVWISLPVVALLLVYVVATTVYSFWAKQVALLDVTMLAGLYTLRLAIGAAAAGVIFSIWLGVFAMFVFLSLSFAKRQTELLRAQEKGRGGMVRGYRQEDSQLVFGLGLASMLAAVLVLVIYLTEEAMPAGVYRNPVWLWCWPLLLWMGLARVWLLTQRGELNDDPVVYALKDIPSWIMMILLGLAAFMAKFSW